jgi:hypothetical protein
MFEYIRVGLLADFAFELFPVVGGDVLSILFDVFLGRYPIFKAFKVNQSYRSSALAGQNQWVF